MSDEAKMSALGPAAGSSDSSKDGSCNTHPTAYQYSTCVDYLKFRFDLDLEKDMAPIYKLLKILGVTTEDAEVTKGMHGYTARVVLAPGISLWYGGSFTKNSNGQSTCVIELTGSGCREFEERYWSTKYMAGTLFSRPEVEEQAWLELLTECKALDGHCTRVDLPTDDFSGEITVAEIRSKVASRQYTSAMKRYEETVGDDVGESQDELEPYHSLQDSKRSGFSATFGGRQKVQLCIYDKKAERISKGLDPECESWIRFEVRYYHKNAEAIVEQLRYALEKHQANSFIVGCLTSLFEFKEANGFNAKNRNKAKTWSKWEKFVENATPIQGFSTAPRTLTIESAGSWLQRNAYACFGRVFFASKCDSREMATSLLLRFLDKCNKADLQVINQYRKLKGYPEYETVEEMRERFYEDGGCVFEFTEDITKLMLTRKTKGEIDREKKEGDGDG